MRMRGGRPSASGYTSEKGARCTEHGVQHVFVSPADQPARPGAALEGSSPSQPLLTPHLPWPPLSVSAPMLCERLNRRRPAPRPPGPASRSSPLLPFHAAGLHCLVGPPLPPPRCPDCLSLLPSEDVLLPAQPQPAQGAARLHQGPRVGECCPRRRGRESRRSAGSRSGPASALGEEAGSPGSGGAAGLARTPRLPLSRGRDGTGRAGRAREAAAWACAGRGRRRRC